MDSGTLHPNERAFEMLRRTLYSSAPSRRRIAYDGLGNIAAEEDFSGDGND